ncbi:MAG: PEP-utilizing enzyme [Cyclobacteriaceae bacterium]|nr:PEP-utilizing enzyme [Cyclobacteriaceae bacterium]
MLAITPGKFIQPGTSGIGGKAKGLLFLQQHQFDVPPFYVIRGDVLTAIRNGEQELPALIHAWMQTCRIAPGSLWAVRSSAGDEDGADRSYAGLFATVTDVPVGELAEAIRRVLRSYANFGQEAYGAQAQQVYGIILQEMVQADYSGLLFSHNPQNVRDATLHVQVVPGKGENLVSGKAEAFWVTWYKGKLTFRNEDGVFAGDPWSGPTKSGSEIRQELRPVWKKLVKSAVRLRRLSNHPVDCEFCLVGRRIYWLQVRPITTGQEEAFVWDNTSCESNYPGITLPLSVTMVSHSMYRVYKGMAAFLGMPRPLLERNETLLRRMSGEINGALYYNVTAWQKLIYQLPFGKRTSQLLTVQWGMEEAPFYPEKYRMGPLTQLAVFVRLIRSFVGFKKLKKQYLDHFERVFEQLKGVKMEGKSQEELVRAYHDIEEALVSNWAAPMLNGFFTMGIFALVKNRLAHSRLHMRHPNFINDMLYSRGDVISVAILRSFQSLVRRIHGDERLRALFQDEAPHQIAARLGQLDPGLVAAIETYVREYGDRSDQGELKMETISFREDPLLFYAYLQDTVKHTTTAPPPPLAFDYHRILLSEYPHQPVRRRIWAWLIRQAIDRVRDRENFRFMRTRAFALVRQVFRAMDHTLVEKKRIRQPGDSLYLTLQELTSVGHADELAELVEARKETYKSYEASEKFTRYIQYGSTWQPQQPGEWVEEGAMVRGTGCCSGYVKGQIKWIDSTEVPDVAACAGKILAANYFEPGKINLFSQALGIISVRGNLLSHTAILCREIGLPSIVGARGLASKIKDGDFVEMDGSTGMIKLQQSE